MQPSKKHHSIWKILFVLGANEYLERLEGKIRKCYSFMLKHSKITVWNLEVHDTLFACERGNWSFSRFERKWRKSGHPCSLTWQMIWWCIDRTLQIDVFVVDLVWCFVAIICRNYELSLSWFGFQNDEKAATYAVWHDKWYGGALTGHCK